MEWGGATIGWAYSNSFYEEHSLSGSSSARIDCLYPLLSTAVAYRIGERVREKGKSTGKKAFVTGGGCVSK